MTPHLCKINNADSGIWEYSPVGPASLHQAGLICLWPASYFVVSILAAIARCPCHKLQHVSHAGQSL